MNDKKIELKKCPLTGLQIVKSEVTQRHTIHCMDGIFFYDVHFQNDKSRIVIETDLWVTLNVKKEEPHYGLYLNHQEKLKELLPIFFGEMSKGNFEKFFKHIIHLQLGVTSFGSSPGTCVYDVAEPVFTNGNYPDDFSKKKELILKYIQKEQEHDFAPINLKDNFRFWASCYMRKIDELKDSLKILANNGLVILEDDNVRLSEKGLYYTKNLNDNKTDKLPMNQDREFSLDVFISHSFSDKKIAQKLIQLLRSAMNIESSRIRCTSVEGYKLEGGVNTDEQLRKEVEDNNLFIGIISKESIQSHYVLYELGARWGLKLPFKPVVCSSDDYSNLKAPLSNYNVLNLSNQGDVMQLLKESADILEKKLEQPTVYLNLISEMIDEINSKNNKVIGLKEVGKTSGSFVKVVQPGGFTEV